MHDKEKAIKKEIRFCSECGEDLDSFGIDGAEIDLEKIQERHRNCKDKGKFKGDKCAMLFIADPDEQALRTEGD
jgi:hypothetical protein